MKRMAVTSPTRADETPAHHPQGASKAGYADGANRADDRTGQLKNWTLFEKADDKEGSYQADSDHIKDGDWGKAFFNGQQVGSP